MIHYPPKHERGLCIRVGDGGALESYHHSTRHEEGDAFTGDIKVHRAAWESIEGKEAFRYLLRTIINANGDPKHWCRDAARGDTEHHMPANCIDVDHVSFMSNGELWVEFKGCNGETLNMYVELGGAK